MELGLQLSAIPNNKNRMRQEQENVKFKGGIFIVSSFSKY
jgi:hypothetical protein